ncbi:hypothetical protein LCGC14_1669770 [marine sediment metagenome]|uniref:Uncharacterized protein n=1 Tax=marine sediment metagenome TaxID=412755 RepID=A0A0F9HSL4_9ZZZZ
MPHPTMLETHIILEQLHQLLQELPPHQHNLHRMLIPRQARLLLDSATITIGMLDIALTDELSNALNNPPSKPSTHQ